ncbi:hypothetical protein [Domibacillus iocasae]|uniref:RelA/SpoT domain-containing protein n=1 Tax=Domibacillus iocasae TaxID=1714016 RepID=A0A1E7DQP2_9BACI|nr:hypothetical protein [Domibacillus iocasae]OES45391.1 hypothetical protein BA724_05145 [Domibacillus iocasae]
MEVLDDNKTLTEEVLKVYNADFQNNLKEIAEEIINHLSEAIKKRESGFSLTYSNNVHSGQYYDFKFRIKESYSLKEKLFRKNLIWKIASDLDGQGTDEQSEGIIKSFLHNLDDLIGIKILTQVKNDSYSIYEILKISKNELKDFGISFDFEEEQPKSMKNGMSIYNIKARYNEYNFELQIKSQIESAWADMDHEMFYKDYGITPIRKSVQQTMNKVGKLLHEVDDLLHSIRSSEIEFNKGQNKLIILKKLSEEFQVFLKEELKNPYNFDFSQYIDFYEYILSKKDCEPKMICKDKVIWPRMNYDDRQESHENYRKIHRRNYDVLVNEIVFASIKNFIVKEDILDVDLNEYLNLYISYIVDKQIQGQEFKEGIQEIVNELLNKCKVSSIYTDYHKYRDIEEYYALVYDEFINNLGLTEDNQIELLNLIGLNFAFTAFENTLILEEKHFDLLFEATNNSSEKIIRMFRKLENDLKSKKRIEQAKKAHLKFEEQIASFIEGDQFE